MSAKKMTIQGKKNSHLVYGEYNPLSEFTVALHQTSERLVYGLWSDLRIPIEAAADDG